MALLEQLEHENLITTNQAEIARELDKVLAGTYMEH